MAAMAWTACTSCSPYVSLMWPVICIYDPHRLHMGTAVQASLQQEAEITTHTTKTRQTATGNLRHFVSINDEMVDAISCELVAM